MLYRIRSALVDVLPSDRDATDTIYRLYLRRHLRDDADVVDRFEQVLTDYRAHVFRTATDSIPTTIAQLLADRGSTSVLLPPGLPADWLSASDVAGVNEAEVSTVYELDRLDSVVTTCSLAIAETGTLVLDGGPGQGRRRSTLVPDHHICVVRIPDQVVASVPEALRRLNPARPLTWISGPSATSDIELDRVEGVHGTRRLDVVLADIPGLSPCDSGSEINAAWRRS